MSFLRNRGMGLVSRQTRHTQDETQGPTWQFQLCYKLSVCPECVPNFWSMGLPSWEMRVSTE